MAKYTSIGGQALIEGIMMKSPEKTAMAVRKQDGDIDVSYLSDKPLKERYKILGIPIIRGAVAFVESLVGGYKAMMKSAEISGFTDFDEQEEKSPETPEENLLEAEESAEKEDALSLGITEDETAGTVGAAEEPPAEETVGEEVKAEDKDEENEEDEEDDSKLMIAVTLIGSVLGVLLAIALFILLPSLAVTGIEKYIAGGKKFSDVARAAMEQGIKLAILVVYVWAVSFMKDIKRVFMYHGAEHKTIFCYEHGEKLTVENVRKERRFHPRCGTSFMILMILVSFLVSIAVMWLFKGIYEIKALWVAIKILLIPLVCGLGYEVLKLCGKHDNIFTKIISAPGLWLQRITTKEPNDDMIEIAIAALKACEPSVPDVDRSIDGEEGTADGTDNI